MIDPGLTDKVVLVTGGNNPFGIGAEIARRFASLGAPVFVHGHPYEVDVPSEGQAREPGLPFFFEQQKKSAGEVAASIREAGGKAAHWDGDLREPENVGLLFKEAEEAFGQVDILVNNAAEYEADTFLPSGTSGPVGELWDAGPSILKKDVRELILEKARKFPKSRTGRAGKHGPKPKKGRGR